MRNAKKQKGFILLYVIVFIPLFSFGTLILTNIGRQMVQDTNRETIQAQNRTLMQSGYQWAMIHPQRLKETGVGEILEPDINGLGMRHGACRVKVHEILSDGWIVEIEVSSRIGRHSLKKKANFIISTDSN